MIIEHARSLSLETPIGGGRALTIAAPRSEHGRSAAERISQALQASGIRPESVTDPDADAMRKARGAVVVVGNLADSRCVQDLYTRFLSATDLWYPGPAGYELRTLCDPFATGHNLILVGYSDAEGAGRAAEALLEHLDDPLPHLAEVKPTRLHLTDGEAEQIRTGPLQAESWQVANDYCGNRGYYHYLTGDREVGEVYKRSWEAIVQAGYDRTAQVVAPHLRSLDQFLNWRFVESMGLFDDEERLTITRFLYGLAESKEGWLHVQNCPRVKPGVPRQNHELIPALGMAMMADYFETHFPDAPGPDRWRAAAAQCFEPYGSSWKPLCDGLCHGWWMSQPSILNYALLESEHRYLAEGGARKAAECALAIVNNEGWMPNAGDADLRRAFPAESLRVAAVTFNDGRYRYAYELASPKLRLARNYLPPRDWAAGVTPVVPEDQVGVTVIPMDDLIHKVWERCPDHAPGVVTTPPSVPIEVCFDKLAVRTGWDPRDDYLLIDGLGGGSHSYDDAGGILDYARLGLSLVVSEDSLVHSAPEHHSAVTVVRDGETGLIPGFAALEANETDDDGNVYLRIRLEDYAGADWVREVHLRPGSCLVLVDTVVANASGDYAVQSHLRVPERLQMDGSEARCRRTSPCVGEVAFRIESSCDPTQLAVVDVPVHLRHKDAEDQARWKERYHTEEVVLSSFVSRTAARLEPGESVRMAHLVQGCGPGEPEHHLSETDEGFWICEGESRHRLKAVGLGKPAARRIAARGPKTSGDSTRIFQAQSRVTALCELDDGTRVVGTEGGEVSFLDRDGRESTGTRLAGPVHDIGVARASAPLVVAGHGPSNLTAFDGKGAEAWATEIVYAPSPWRWWELVTHQPVAVAGTVTGDSPFFAVGCGDLKVRGIDPEGRELWKERYNAGVPGRIQIADPDGSGSPRIFAGGGYLSASSTCFVYDLEGQHLVSLPVEGWTSLMTALTFGEAGGRPLMACGASRGRNLHLFHVAGEPDTWERLWLRRLGGEVAGILIREDRLIVATSQGFLMGYDLEGEPMWSRLCDRGITHLVPVGDEAVVVEDSGKVSLAGLDGDISSATRLPGPCAAALAEGRSVTLASGSEVWRLSIGT